MKIAILLAALVLGSSALARSDARPAAAPPVFITLGTGGGPRVQTERSQPANAIVVNGAIYLFDVGEGTQRQLKAAGLDLRQVRAIFLSHFHIDHVGGLHPLIVGRWVQGVVDAAPVIGPPGTVEMVDSLVAASRPIELAPVTLGTDTPPIGWTVAPRELPSGADTPVEIYRDANIRVLAVTNDHYHFAPGSQSARLARSYAFRIEAAGTAVVYSGDTGPSARLEALAADADLLVSEVMDLPAIERSLRTGGFEEPMLEGVLRHLRAGHVTPVEAGNMARQARVKMLVLTHLVPGVDEDPNDAGYLRGLSAAFQGPVVVARDLDRFEPARPQTDGVK